MARKRRGRGASGWIAGAGSRRACCASRPRAARPRRLRPMAAVGPVGLDEVRKVLAERLRTLAVEPPRAPLRPRLRRRADAGARPRPSASCSCPAWPSGCFRRSCARIRCCSTTARRAGVGLPVVATTGRRRRAAAAAAGGRRRDRAAVRVVSAPRRRTSRGRACRRSTRSTSCARSTGRIPSHDDLQREACDDGAATLAWPAPADPAAGDRRARARPRDAAAAARRARSRDGARAARATCSELNACLRRSVRERWARYQQHWSRCRRPRSCHDAHRRPRSPRSGSARGRIRCRRCSTTRRARTGSCCRRSIGSRRARTPSRCSGSIR